MRSAKTNLSPVPSEEMRPLTADEIDVVAGGLAIATVTVDGTTKTSNTGGPIALFPPPFNAFAYAHATATPGGSSSTSISASTGNGTASSSALAVST